ncbi:type IV secretion system protein VirB10 [Methylobacterium radiotolerans]|uniref:type IV secretion system protein VirB10 n=1 Tax=Methylobacterium radiotolerans TaxID=31998 RepID=UPI0009772BBB|nr:type IV secretion system protein VirB10 [Methylobacterium radiotolerans]
MSEVAGTGDPARAKKLGIAGMIAFLVLACGAILLTSKKPDLKTRSGTDLEAKAMVSYEPPPPLPTQTPTPAPTPTPGAVTQPLPLPVQAAPSTAPRPIGGTTPQPTRLLIYNANGGTSAGAGGTAAQGGSMMAPVGYQDAAGGYPGVGGGREGRDSLGARLTPTQLNGVSANVLANQPYLLTTGTLIPCVLQTAMESTLPGFVTCVIPQDILGKTGITLLDRGTKVVGQFQGGIRQGVERMFVIWTRAETPQGVVINLDSAASDPLGRAGLDGDVDRHFWQRFGGAIIMSIVDGAMATGQQAVAKSGTVTLNTGNSSSVVNDTLHQSTDLPPTVRKNQGELVSIFVARDLDFSSVYRLAPTARTYASKRR